MATIFVIDDEKTLVENISIALKKEGYIPEPYYNGLEAWEKFQKKRPDLIILDIMMPRMDGLELCRKIRGVDESVPVIFLSSRDDELDRIIGLEMGGDDYLCKPFSMKELMVRIKIILKRSERYNSSAADSRHEMEMGPLKLNTATGRCFWKDSGLILTVTELRILESLLDPIDTIKTREQLMKAAFPEDCYINERAMDSHIKRLRKKFVNADPCFDAVETVYGLGYRFRKLA